MASDERLLSWVAWFFRYIWAGWAGAAGLACVAAAWQVVHELYGDFVLPSPVETIAVAFALLGDVAFQQMALITGERALMGYVVVLLIGTISGIIAGYSFATMRLMRPMMIFMLGVPPIGWIVLALIWFPLSGGSAILTVIVASLPVIFIAAIQGVATRDRALDMMARSFNIGMVKRFITVTLPHLLSYLFPAWSTTAGSAWKIVVMAELLSNAGGIGGELASSRALFDIPRVTAIILLIAVFALITEFGIIQPLRDRLEQWRVAGLPWGVKR